MLIKLDGENIIGHHGDDKQLGYDAQVNKNILIDMDGKYKGIYKYKYVKGELILLNEQEKLAHPLYQKSLVQTKIDSLLENQVLLSTKAKLVEVSKLQLSLAEAKEVQDRIKAIDDTIAAKA